MDNLKTNDEFKVLTLPLDRPLHSSTITENKETGASKSDLQDDKPKSDEKKYWTISDFDMGRSLGKGTFGYVYLAKEKKSQYVVALKVLFRSQIDNYDMKHQVRREVEIQCRLRHPNILRLYGWFHDEKRIYMILEYAKYGTLYKILEETGRFDEKIAAIYIRDLTKALIYCHAEKIIHRDLKPENLLIGENWQLKIADFGWSVQLMQGNLITMLLIYGVSGLSVELLVGLPPFKAQDSHQTYRKIYNIIIKYPEFISEKAKDLMGKLLVVNPEQRLPLTYVLQHPWIIDNAPEGVPLPVFQTEQKQS